MKLYDLNENELEIYYKIVADKEKFLNMTLNNIASELYTSKTSLIRMASKLGFSGFSEFKYYIKNQDSKNVDFKIDRINKITSEVKNTLVLINETDLEKSVKMIKDSSMVLIFSVGINKHLAKYLSNELMMANINSFFVSDPHMMKMMGSTLDKQGVVIVLSNSGNNASIREPIVCVKEKGAKVIEISANKNSEIGKHADVSHNYGSKDIKNAPYDKNSRLGSLMYIQLITEQLLLK